MRDTLRVVNRAPENQGWAVRPSEDAPPLRLAGRKVDAIDLAIVDLAEHEGDELRIYLTDGRLERRRMIEGSAAPAAASPWFREPEPTDDRSATAGEVADRIDRQGEHVDAWLMALSLIITLIGPAAAAYVSPVVRDAAGEGWMAVAFATLTWTLACAWAYVATFRSGLGGTPLLVACCLGIAVSAGIAGALGTGVLDLTPVGASGGGPGGKIAAFVLAAVETYGIVGALIGLGVGVWLGHNVAPLFPKDFARSS